MSIRPVIFLLGCLLMALALLMPLAVDPTPPRRFGREWIFDLGLLLALAAHGWPENLR